MGPKWCPKWLQNGSKMGPKWGPKLAQNGSKMRPKSSPFGEAKMMVFHWFYKEKLGIHEQGRKAASPRKQRDSHAMTTKTNINSITQISKKNKSSAKVNNEALVSG